MFKKELYSISQTFLATFLFLIATFLVENQSILWDKALIVSVVLGALRSAIKIVIQKYAPTILGGVKTIGQK